MERNILHTSIRVDSINDAHTRLSIFQGMTYPDVDPQKITRGLSGSLCIDTAAAPTIINSFPCLVQITVASAITEIPEWLHVLHEHFQFYPQHRGIVLNQTNEDETMTDTSTQSKSGV